MSQTKSVVVVKRGEAQVKSVAVPKLRDNYILVKVKAVALNPTDVSFERLLKVSMVVSTIL